MTLDEFKLAIEEYLEDDLAAITPKERIAFFLSLSEFYRPKLSRGSEPPSGDLKEILIQHVHASTDKDNPSVSRELETDSKQEDHDQPRRQQEQQDIQPVPDLLDLADDREFLRDEDATGEGLGSEEDDASLEGDGA